ncbi:hypothetical protein ACFE04_018569 [Oxalis oulophora]
MQTPSRKKKQAISSAHGVPSDLTEGILSILPVKSLLRFRCVSKPWCIQIDDPHFILLHAKKSCENVSDFSLIYQKNRALYLSCLMSSNNPEKHEYPFKLGRRYARLVGSLNGLVCLLYTGDTHFVVWNISTRKYNSVRSGLSSCTNSKICLIGFGYESINDDYKLVMVFVDRGPRIVCDVYSLKTNTWRRSPTQAPSSCISNKKDVGICCNDALHWMTPIARTVFAFALATEQWQDVPLPDNVRPTHLGSLKGCLYLITRYQTCNIDVWVMKVYGVKDSWTKSVSVSLETISQQPLRFRYYLIYAIIGDKILIKDGLLDTVILYDTKNKSVEHFDGIDGLWEGFLYSESLVPLPPAAAAPPTNSMVMEPNWWMKSVKEHFVP